MNSGGRMVLRRCLEGFVALTWLIQAYTVDKKEVMRRVKDRVGVEAASNVRRPDCGKVLSTEPGRWYGNISLDGLKGQRLTYDLDACQLRRYTASEARQCLAGKHLVMVGDSLMRYQYLSLVYFLHFGAYPEPGNPESRMGEPNVCMEGDYVLKINNTWRQKYGLSATATAWDAFMPATSQMFGGQERCDCYRTVPNKEELHVENRYYKDPVADIGVTYILKTFLPIHGHYPRARDGTQPPGILTEGAFHANSKPTDWTVSDTEFVTDILPLIEKDQGKVSHFLWNTGIWAKPKNWTPLMHSVHNFMKERQGRAFWKGTSRDGMGIRRFADGLVREGDQLAEKTAAQEGWEILDAKRILAKLILMSDEQEDGSWVKYKDNFLETYDGLRTVQYFTIKWDLFHFKPWVYEELNNLWLNMICN